MKILLVNIDSSIPNYALAKIEKYHKDRGDQIFHEPLFRDIVDKVYISCVFTKNKQICFSGKNIEVGGSGYDLKKELPSEIEAVKPRINLGFTTRGCLSSRKCKFCIVWEKEGGVRVVGDLLDLWDGKAKEITLLDNNILAIIDHFKLICKQARENNIRIDFNQGLDHRLLTDEICEELTITPITDIRFAFDDPKYINTVDRTINLLNKYKLGRAMWYVIVGFNTTVEDDFMRLNYLYKRKQRPYVMKHENCGHKEIYTQMARWCNSPLWRGISWENFLLSDKNKNISRELKKQYINRAIIVGVGDYAKERG